MLLDLAKAASFFLCILSLYHAAIHAFFVPGAHWRERLVFALVRLAFAGCICLLSGMLFTLPARTNPDADPQLDQPLARTLPVRLYLWSVGAIAVLFTAGWYLGDLAQQCGPFISSRAMEKF
jgi:hypothetical protein